MTALPAKGPSSPAICDMLLQAYFDWLHPCFPTIAKVYLQSNHQNGILSHCSSGQCPSLEWACTRMALNTTGFNNRYQAKEVFYRRAKGIYNSGWERDTVVKLQSLFSSEFLAGPTEERDVRFSLAQKKGIHVIYDMYFILLGPNIRWHA